jgi:hypothetical protein
MKLFISSLRSPAATTPAFIFRGLIMGALLTFAGATVLYSTIAVASSEIAETTSGALKTHEGRLSLFPQAVIDDLAGKNS